MTSCTFGTKGFHFRSPQHNGKKGRHTAAFLKAELLPNSRQRPSCVIKCKKCQIDLNWYCDCLTEAVETTRPCDGTEGDKEKKRHSGAD